MRRSQRRAGWFDDQVGEKMPEEGDVEFIVDEAAIDKDFSYRRAPQRKSDRGYLQSDEAPYDVVIRFFVGCTSLRIPFYGTKHIGDKLFVTQHLRIIEIVNSTSFNGTKKTLIEPDLLIVFGVAVEQAVQRFQLMVQFMPQK